MRSSAVAPPTSAAVAPPASAVAPPTFSAVLTPTQLVLVPGFSLTPIIKEIPLNKWLASSLTVPTFFPQVLAVNILGRFLLNNDKNIR